GGGDCDRGAGLACLEPGGDQVFSIREMVQRVLHWLQLSWASVRLFPVCCVLSDWQAGQWVRLGGQLRFIQWLL
ncbi:hypothetical protein VV869_21550, partial [Photobacterium sp. MCCC 1A19761]|uniref:hypothetical protein n=1 Tax=Photobacterium sp. MCCC 1A19761 TaxID=3115000 RepID=UPI00307DD36A